jgi:hypothetical protein
MKFTAASWSFFVSAVAAVLIGAPSAGVAKDPVNTNFSGVAVKGYDPVAYFTEAKPICPKKDDLFALKCDVPNGVRK